MHRVIRRLGDASARRPWVTIGAWVAAAAIVMGLAGTASGGFVADFVAPGSQSEEAMQLLEAFLNAETETSGTEAAGLLAALVVLVVGFGTIVAALVLTGLGTLASIGLSTSLVVLFAVATALTLLPALLTLLGDRIDAGRLLRRRRPATRAEDTAWWRLAHRGSARPLPYLAVGSVVLLALTAPALRMETGFPDAGDYPTSTTQRRTYDLLADGFGPGVNALLLLVVFRSVAVPLKAAVMNLLSIGAAYGVVVAIFQWGWLKDLFGLEGTSLIASPLPAIFFAVLFGLSMDDAPVQRQPEPVLAGTSGGRRDDNLRPVQREREDQDLGALDVNAVCRRLRRPLQPLPTRRPGRPRGWRTWWVRRQQSFLLGPPSMSSSPV